MGGFINPSGSSMTGAAIKTAYESEADTNDFDDAAKAKLANVSLTQFLKGTVTDPPALQAIDAQVPIWTATNAAITITSIKLTCDADPITELDIDLKFADSLIGLANATVIDICDTTSGVFSATSGFDNATVPSGKCIYFEFGAAPDENMLWFSFEIQFTYDA